MNELEQAEFLQERGGSESPQEVLTLLAERIDRYTMGDSTSVPIDTATRLLEGIAYCVSLERTRELPLPKDAPLKERSEAGRAEAKRLSRRAKLLLREAQRWQPPVTNTGFRDTLDALPDFFKWYDPDFFAQEMPCSFDYPLSQPVSDALSGVEYLLDYLRRWLAESRFLRCFSEPALVRLYEQYYGDYVDLLVNLYLPVAEMALLCALARQSIQPLFLSDTALNCVSEQLLHADETTQHRLLLEAADRVLCEAGVEGVLDRAYLLQTGRDLCVRMRAAQSGNRAGVTNELQKGTLVYGEP